VDQWRVACVWLPQLPLRVEVLRRPELDGRPLVLGSASGERKEVRLCSPEAAGAGIRPGLPLREVPSLCPAAVVVQPDPVRTTAVIDGVTGALEQVSPLVEPSLEELFLDLRGLSRLYEHSFDRLELAIRAAVPGLLRPRIGVAGGKFAASVAARTAGSTGVQVVPPWAVAGFLAPLPIDHLPFSPPARERLRLLGLRTIGDLAALPFAAVQAQFGPDGARAWRLAQGQDDDPVVPRRSITRVPAALRFEEPIGSADTVMAAVRHLLSAAFADPELRARSARRVGLRALLSDGTSWERVYALKEPLAGSDGVYRFLSSKLALPGELPAAPVEEIAVELSGLGGEAARQLALYGIRPTQLEQLSQVVRQLRTRYGRVPLYHAVEVDPWSRIPERRWALVTCSNGG
jgi:nucleotidyltransferase/DNA polymerase involved in DNA repair